MKTKFKQAKVILLFLFAILSFSGSSQAQTPEPFIHFMQKTPTPAHAIPYGNNPETGHFVNVGDAKIYYELYGKGQPVVVLHGGVVGSTYEMHQFIDSLKKGYQVIAVSTRGHGKSELGTEPITYEQKAADVLAVINAETTAEHSTTTLRPLAVKSIRCLRRLLYSSGA